MKRSKIIVFLCLGILNNICAQNGCQQVSLSEAVQVALHRVNDGRSSQTAHLQATYQKTDIDGNILLYEIVTDSVTILLSGSKACTPVLGEYRSSDGSIIKKYDNLPCGLRTFVDGYMAHIERCFRDDVDRNYHQDTWDSLINGIETINRFAPIEPLIITRWKQIGCNTGYDVGYEYYIPGVSGMCEHCKAGCGAVAMGQVMKYWSYPVVCYQQERQFDWCNMSMDLNIYSSTFIQNREAIARLLEDCWYKILDWANCNQTYSSLDSTRNALVNSYGYDSHAQIVTRSGYSGNWDEMLINQLTNGWPVIYSGKGNHGSHTFVCCGVNRYGEFYINWGNGGEFDGYFKTTDLHYYDTNFSNDQQAIINIYPSTNDDLCDMALFLDDFYYSFYQGSGNEYWQPYDVTPSTMATLISATSSSSSSWRTIPDGATATYQAHEEVHLRDGFTVERGAEFTARIVPCPNCEENREAGSPETASAPSNTTPPETATAHTQSTTDYQPPTTDLYPNPTSGEVTVGVDGEVQAIIIYTPMGLPVGGWRLLSIGADRVTLDLSPLPAGTYILHIQTPMGVSTKRLVVAR